MSEETRSIELSEAQIELIAERAAKKALEKVYAEIGESMLKKLAWFAGLVVVFLAMWFAGKGYLKLT